METWSQIKASITIASVTLAASISFPASAQNSTTTCSRMGAYVNCDTQTQPQQRSGPDDFLSIMKVLPDPNSFQEGQQQAERLRQQQLQNQLMQQQLAEQRRLADERARQQSEATSNSMSQSTMRREVFYRIMEGDCPGAIKIALLTGDMDFAIKTKTFCASGDASKPRP